MADHLTRHLTARERDIAALVAESRTNAEIGAVLAIAPTTAKWHVSQILRKLNLRSRVQLAVCVHAHASAHGPAAGPAAGLAPADQARLPAKGDVLRTPGAWARV
jgi:DNA-binding CsgD family transcriptional regulator